MTNNTPKFSVIIPAYKRNEIVKVAIFSILNQNNFSKKQVEIIISDDEDDINIRKINRNFFSDVYKDTVYTMNVNEEGPGGNRQSGFDLAKGKYVIFLDSDDRLKPNFLLEMENGINKIDCVSSVCFSVSLFEKGFSVKEKLKLLPLIFIRDVSLYAGYLFNKKTIYPSSFYLCQISHMMFKRKMIEEQKFNYDYRRGGEDWDFFVQTLKKGSIAIIPKKLVIFRYSKGSSTDSLINKINKWNSYRLLRSRLTNKFQKWPYFQLMGAYIKIFGK